MIIFGRKNKVEESKVEEEGDFLDKCTVLELRRIKKSLSRDIELYQQMKELREFDMINGSEESKKSANFAIEILDQNIEILNKQIAHVSDELLAREQKTRLEKSEPIEKERE